MDFFKILILILDDNWASPREKSKEKGQRQEVKFVCLNIKKNTRQLDIRAHFWPHFFAFCNIFGHIGSGPKNTYFKESN